MLLNIGSDADRAMQNWQASIMAHIGAWMQKHGEAIYGCTGEWQSPLNNTLIAWKSTHKGDILDL